MNRPDNLFYYYSLLIAPAVIVIAVLTLFPLCTVFVQSFQKYDFIQGDRQFVFLRNYFSISRDPAFWKALKNTFIFSFSATFAETLMGFLAALLFYRPFKGKLGFSLVLMAPMMISTIVVSALWRSMYHYDIGVLNFLALRFGSGRIPWLISPKLALFSIVITDVWQWMPFVFIMLSAALQTLPRDVLDAARIDGCGVFRSVRSVIVPMLGTTLATVVLLRTIDTFRLFSKVYAMTGGGPGNSTETLSYYIYREAFSFFHFGRSGAASITAFAFIMMVALLYIPRILKGDRS